MSAQLEQIKKNYGYDPASVEWIGKGGEIFEYLGMEVMRLNFTRTEVGDPEKGTEDKWENKVGKSLLLRCENFDPMTETVDLVWKDVDYSKPEDEWEIHTTKITPIGFSYGDPGESGEMIRFMPYSLHTKKIETEALFAKLGFLMTEPIEKSKAVNLLQFEPLSASRDRERLLAHIINIAAVIKPVDEEFVYIYRLGNVSLKHQFKGVWKMTAKDTNGRGEITLFIDTTKNEETGEENMIEWEMRNSQNQIEAKVRFFDLRTAFSLPDTVKKEDNKE